MTNTASSLQMERKKDEQRGALLSPFLENDNFPEVHLVLTSSLEISISSKAKELNREVTRQKKCICPGQKETSSINLQPP